MSGKEYAARHGVSPSCVSLWISRGKLYGPALTGRHSIVVEEADKQLQERLDPFRGRPRGAEFAPQPSSSTPDAIAAAVARARQAWLDQDLVEFREYVGHVETFIAETLAKLDRSDVTDVTLAEFRRWFSV